MGSSKKKGQQRKAAKKALAAAAASSGGVDSSVSGGGGSSKIVAKVRIGDNVIVGANSLLNCDIDNNTVVYGNPARVQRKRKQDDSYLR